MTSTNPKIYIGNMSGASFIYLLFGLVIVLLIAYHCVLTARERKIQEKKRNLLDASADGGCRGGSGFDPSKRGVR